MSFYVLRFIISHSQIFITTAYPLLLIFNDVGISSSSSEDRMFSESDEQLLFEVSRLSRSLALLTALFIRLILLFVLLPLSTSSWSMFESWCPALEEKAMNYCCEFGSIFSLKNIYGIWLQTRFYLSFPSTSALIGANVTSCALASICIMLEFPKYNQNNEIGKSPKSISYIYTQICKKITPISSCRPWACIWTTESDQRRADCRTSWYF